MTKVGRPPGEPVLPFDHPWLELPQVAQRPKLSPTERAARGREARKRSPRRSSAAWRPRPDRPDPIDLLEEQAGQRAPDLVPIRYGRMATSPFAFYRGGALLMASDLATLPTSGIRVQACGDAHPMNFGLFESPERHLVFDVNDFDETLPGPWEWDVKRLAAGFEIAQRDLGFDTARRRAVVVGCARSYREAMLRFAGLRAMDVWYARLDVDDIATAFDLSGATGRLLERTVTKASSHDSLRALDRLTHDVDGVPRLSSAPPLLVPVGQLLNSDEKRRFAPAVESALSSYRASLPEAPRTLFDLYRFSQMARKVVGVGSVGTRAWVMLFFGRDAEDPLFLQAKQAQASVLERFVGRSRYGRAGRRVVEGQRLMQAASDVLLGWYSVVGFDGRPYDFFVRQLWDGKGSFDVERMDEAAWGAYARICAWTLARAHARTGDRIQIAAYLGGSDTFDEAIADFADAYAEQNQRDYQALVEAIDTGRIEARAGV